MRFSHFSVLGALVAGMGLSVACGGSPRAQLPSTPPPPEVATVPAVQPAPPQPDLAAEAIGRSQETIVTWPLAYPASWTVDDGCSPERWVGTLAPVPVVVIHGTKDTIVPCSHGEILFRLAKDPKGFWRVENGGHTTALLLPAVRRQLLDFLESVLPPQGETYSSPSIGRDR